MDTIRDAYVSAAVDGPKYRAVAAAVRAGIMDGTLAPGDRLPPVRDLAWTLEITPGTVARAYALLTDEGATSGEVGRGTFVAVRTANRLPPREADWARHAAPEDSAQVSLFAPKLPDLGQVALIRDGFARLAERPARDLLNYPSREGYAPARQAVLRWLEGTVLGPLGQEDLVLSHGGQSAVSLVMQAVLTGRRPVVLVEALSYPGFRRAAQLLRAEVVTVPMDEHGLIPGALEDLAMRHEAQLLCTSPEVHNPTGLITPDARRAEIAEVAARLGLNVLEDDCYRLGRPTGSAYRALLPDLGWHVSSISKTLTPALRIGFAVAPKPQVPALRRAAEYGFFGLSRPLADLTEDLLTRDETYRLMANVRAELGRYIAAAVSALDGCDVTWHADIPFLWLKLPEGWRAASFVQAAEAQGVQVRPAEDFAPRDGYAPHAVRIAVNAQVTLESFAAAMARLRALINEPPERIAV